MRSQDAISFYVFPESPELALPGAVLFPQERGAAADKIIDKVDEGDLVLRVARGFAEVIQQFLPFMLVDSRRRDNLLVTYYPRISPTKFVDACPVAEFNKQRFPQEGSVQPSGRCR